MSTQQFRRPPTAQEAVLDELRREIASGGMAPGSAIPQAAVAEKLGVSRVPVREALKILEGEGHVTYAPHRGYTVTELDAAELLEIYRVRGLLESYAVQHAAPRLTGELAAKLDELVGEMDRYAAAEDLGGLSEANRTFHFLIYEASAQSHLVRLIRQLWDASDPYRTVYFGGADNRVRIQEEHREIAAAVARGDADRVADLLKAHRDHACDVVVAVLGEAS
ncbi:GntR family transcriptional regulator [Saccharopolyspora shandongensis]|uniref:GntR family transcriptional regulator n=1 Tax=Saccharopolyspora shandongensis TaxID=418495 RepID=UPI0033CC728E